MFQPPRTTIVKEEYVAPEEGVYNAEVSKVEMFVSEKHPEYGTSIKFVFRLLDEPYTSTNVNGLVNASWKPGNKLDKWLRALGLENADVGSEVNPSVFVGRKAQVTLEKNPKNDFINVKMVHPMRATPATAPAAILVPVVVQAAAPAPVAAPAAPYMAPQPMPMYPTTPAPVVPQPTFVPPQRPRSIPF